MQARTHHPLCRLIVVLACHFVNAAVCWGHPPVTTAAMVNVTDDRLVKITVNHDALAFASNRTSALMSTFDCYALLIGPERDLAAAFADGRARFMSEFLVTVDGVRLPVTIVESPTVEAVRIWKADHPDQTLPCAMNFLASVELPAGAGSMSLRFPEALGNTIMIVHRPRVESINLPLRPGEASPLIDVRMVSATGSNADQQPAGTTAPATRSSEAPDDQFNALSIAWRYVTLGFGHIIPDGVDHCLFVLGLFLLIPRFKPVLLQITAFTVAHTVTLTLTSLDIVGLSGSIVEPAIAASIAFIAIENLCTKKVHRWRYVVAFVFGLVHGMGVATVFKQAGFPPGQLVTSLAAFTVGVEAGHVSVLAAAFGILGWWRDKPWYRTRIAIPISLVIAIIALVWVVQRLTGSW